MSSTTEVTKGLEAIAWEIVDARAFLEKSISNAQLASENLNQISVTYADVIATIEAYTGADSVETVTKDQLTRLTTERDALIVSANTIAGTSLD